MRSFHGIFLAATLGIGGCGISYPATPQSKTPANPVIESQSLKGDIQELLDRAIARDDVIMAEAAKFTRPADQARLTHQAYIELLKGISQVRDRAAGLDLNPFEAKKRKAILEEAGATLWKLRYQEKEGSARARTDEARLELYDRLHTEELASFNRIQNILRGQF